MSIIISRKGPGEELLSPENLTFTPFIDVLGKGQKSLFRSRRVQNRNLGMVFVQAGWNLLFGVTITEAWLHPNESKGSVLSFYKAYPRLLPLIFESE